MNERQIACFLAVKRNLNFSRAAKQLFITQPALSYQITSLENELGAKLFRRTTTSVNLTEAGMAFSAPAEKFYNQYLEAVSSVRRYTDQKNRITLMCPRVMTMRDKIYREMIARIIATFPQYEVEIRIHEKGMDNRTGLLSGIDGVIGMKPHVEEKDVEYHPLFQTMCYIVAGPKHALTGKKSMLPEELDGQMLYYEDGDQEYVEIIRRIAKEAGAAVSLKEVFAYDTVYPDLMAGKGLFVSPMIFGDFPKEWYIPLQTDALPPTVFMCLKEPVRPYIRVLAQLVQQVHQEYIPQTELPAK